MQIIAVTNIKGGVGKTTTAVNLAFLAARDGLPTLLWDLDPQGAAIWLLLGTPGEHGSARQLVHGKRELDELVMPSGYPNLDLLPSPLSVRMLATLQEFAAREGWFNLVLLPFFSMVDRRRSLHVDVITATRARFPFTLGTELPYRSEIERMSVRRAPLPAYAPRSVHAVSVAAQGSHRPVGNAARRSGAGGRRRA